MCRPVLQYPRLNNRSHPHTGAVANLDVVPSTRHKPQITKFKLITSQRDSPSPGQTSGPLATGCNQQNTKLDCCHHISHSINGCQQVVIISIATHCIYASLSNDLSHILLRGGGFYHDFINCILFPFPSQISQLTVARTIADLRLSVSRIAGPGVTLPRQTSRQSPANQRHIATCRDLQRVPPNTSLKSYFFDEYK